MQLGSVADWASVLVNAVLAGLVIYGFGAWKAEFRTQKRYEVAARIIEAFTTAEEDLAYCRARFIQGNTGEVLLTRTLKTYDDGNISLSPPDEVRMQMLAPAAILERIQNQRVHDDFAKLEELRHQVGMTFGLEAKKAIETLLRQKYEVATTAEIYLHQLIQDFDIDVHEGENGIAYFKSVLFASPDGDDTVAKEIKAAKQVLEELTEPILKIARA